MKKIILALVLAAALPAHAATAFLLNCEGTTSVTGRFVYVGTYQYGSTVFQRTFVQWCPATVEVY